MKRKLLSKLYVDRRFTEDSDEWQKELQEGVCTDQDETREVQEKRS